MSKEAQPVTHVTLTTFADVVGCSLPTVRAAIRRGMPTLGRTGREHRIELKAGVQWWVEDIETRHHAELENASDDPAMKAAKRRKLEAEAALREQELAVGAATLIDAAHAERDGFESARTIRESVLNVPDRITAELAAESVEARVHARLETELRLALEAASNALRKKKAAAV